MLKLGEIFEKVLFGCGSDCENSFGGLECGLALFLWRGFEEDMDVISVDATNVESGAARATGAVAQPILRSRA